MGNHRDGVYRETGIIDEITLDGLKVKWRKPAGSGYSGPVVAGKRVFLFDYVKQSGDAFNADDHEAITQIPAPSDDLKGKIIDVIEKGYKLGDKVIRFPKVVIGQ